MTHTRHRVTLVACLLLTVSAVWAQAVYRSVGPDGRVTYSDQPPPADAPANGTKKPVASDTDNTSTAGNLPYALRQVTAQFPVTLYSGPGCGPCNTGRALLASRGVPFAEYTVSTVQDATALARIAGSSALPFVTIGGQHLQGFSDTEWNQYLDLAGYPKQSQLPSSYRNTPAVPLTQPEPEPEPSVSPRAPAPRPAPRPRPTPDNPAGIQF